MVFALVFLTRLLTTVFAVDQPDRWEPINSDHEYFATKSILANPDPDRKDFREESEFIQFYYRNSKNAESDSPDQIMSVRKSGIYTTARWDYTNMKENMKFSKT